MFGQKFFTLEREIILHLIDNNLQNHKVAFDIFLKNDMFLSRL